MCESINRMVRQSVRLSTSEGVDLANAWVARLAHSVGARALLIKGAALHRLQLRQPRASSDVDILVLPGDFAKVCQALIGAGWQERRVSFLLKAAPNHSRSFIHADWPCDIDVHSHYPGFLADPNTVFDTLWARAKIERFAAQDCLRPDRPSSALILALHSLRSTEDSARHRQELSELYEAPFTPAEHAAIGMLAALTASAEPLDAVLTTLGVDALPPSVPAGRPIREAWRIQVGLDGSTMGTYRWVQALRTAPLAQKPTVLWRAIWPTDEDLLLIRPGLPLNPRARNAARRQRLLKGIAALPRVVQAAWKSRRQR
ncbi:MAG: nucleotidyltransferase family protein [Tessaracoccus sp.]|jgi:hypothetical protein|uniref:nucleotidyltransferase family protein n=1 Tax=Tessaracoccus sp. TaxID=1971211 RepID=UPI001ED325AB|nr:nucleotidyltransferase family protein [Tessaracoccus sp.]MBK7822449.1 nucleotidyltransferase family protein [Tessaracoccus sp.]